MGKEKEVVGQEKEKQKGREIGREEAGNILGGEGGQEGRGGGTLRRAMGGKRTGKGIKSRKWESNTKREGY